MSGFLTDLGYLAGQNHFLAYFVIYISTIFLGNISAFTGFWIVFQGFLGNWGIPLLMLTVFIAAVSGDILWYSLGSALRETSFGNFIRNRIPNHDAIEEKIKTKGERWLIFSKFLYAASFPIVFSIGWSRIGLKRFMKISIIAASIWPLILLGLSSGLFFRTIAPAGQIHF